MIYFQPDREVVFSGLNHTKPGYFSYQNDGFGPVVEGIEDFKAELDKLIELGAMPDEYRARVDRTFAFRDGRNSERVFEAITEKLKLFDELGSN